MKRGGTEGVVFTVMPPVNVCMSDSEPSGAKIRPLTQAEIELLAWEFGSAPYCRSKGCREMARRWCSVDLSGQTVQVPCEYCDRHAREFAVAHGLDPNF